MSHGELGHMNGVRTMEGLLAGNRRYVESRQKCPGQSSHLRVEVTEGQDPFAVILGCSDSRVPPELIFDQGVGDPFVVRVAGNLVGNMILASIE